MIAHPKCQISYKTQHLLCLLFNYYLIFVNVNVII